ncbi:MAG: single-stranded-DNA-specific exonuclease RecJ [bacterium]
MTEFCANIKAIEEIINISEEFSLPPRIAQLIHQRGVTLKTARDFLMPGKDNLNSPSLLPDIDRALERIINAIEKKERILIFGDFDADGISSTALLYDALSLITSNVSHYIPSRLNEGYDLGKDVVVEKAGEGYHLMITADCGSKAVDSIEAANKLGMDVIVTDHHLMGEELPQAVAVVNPVRDDSSYPFKFLAGVGVAYKLIKAFSETYTNIDADVYLDLVALGTVADVVPLTGENRVLVKLGVERMREEPRPWLSALCQTARMLPTKLTSWHLAYSIVPRVNSAGRLGSAEISLNLLTSKDDKTATHYASLLEAKNSERKKICDEVYREVSEIITDEDVKDALVLASPKWHSGVIGIVATRFVEKYKVPVVLISTEIPPARGSVRSNKDFDTIKALDYASEVLIRYGGHREASGFLIDEENIPRFKELFIEYVRDSEKEAIEMKGAEPRIVCDLNEIDNSLTEGICILEPFGVDNPEPVFLIRNVKVLSRPEVVNNYHIRFQITDGKNFLGVYYHNGLSKMSQLYPGKSISVVGTPYKKFWRDFDYIEIRARQIGPPIEDDAIKVRLEFNRKEKKDSDINVRDDDGKILIEMDGVSVSKQVNVNYHRLPRGYHEIGLWINSGVSLKDITIYTSEKELLEEERNILREIPDRGQLVRIYQKMIAISQDGFIGLDQIKSLIIEGIDKRAIRCAIMVFYDLGLIKRDRIGYTINKRPPPDTNLYDSVFYRIISAERGRIVNFYKTLRSLTKKGGASFQL